MIELTFVGADGARKTVTAPEGTSVMQAARDHDIEAIRAECGGAMACATCHCYVDDADAGKVGTACEDERDMLDFAETELRETSRLSCQIRLTPALNGLTVHLPDAQI
ncbi:2Fe-2S iron-sulfur cluster-binding protein [Psychromarinibacter sp. C21-152]|uniref:2Fe-2S iron-sulfur cluster-binding protein n=1 Tax=Psychromarinibacter sediminicola TaxID=3033385 RepID=A0AAE3NQY6_9RHOB|nr:2Fe-2S iron-sulfur cluster-binding protein [Psychromarinibacter sediminicola]MDF0600801.1 2Fe-2S iron-sulfur cluster-binding protein [Psychromarinibacter sediminicola]